MEEEAILLSSGNSSPAGEHVTALLDFFGVRSRKLSLDEFLRDESRHVEASVKVRLFSSADTFLQLVTELECRPDGAPNWQRQVQSAFVYAAADPGIFQNLVRKLTKQDAAVINWVNAGSRDFSVLDDVTRCGVMAGVTIRANSAAESAAVVVFQDPNQSVTQLVSAGSAAVFLKIEYQDVPIFFSTSQEIIDVNAMLSRGIFDIREHILPALPIVLYLKWAFPATSWKAAEINACLIIDDPLLKPTHGFVNFRKLLALMKRHRFSTNIAFIPWNWRRSVPDVIQLFKENQENLSISVHGCDHTRAEFGISNQGRLQRKVEQALDRMSNHAANTGLEHDRVMVFPQGVFSEAAVRAVKHSELIAAVNNDTISADTDPRPITVSDVWAPALMCYSDCAIFTRRYPWEGLENFAFDILLGKPAISVIHHDYLSDHGKRLVDFVDGLNALNCHVRWRDLGAVVRRSCRQRAVSPERTEVEMYASELRLENFNNDARRFTVRKRESHTATVKSVNAGSRSLTWRAADDSIEFDIDLKPRESTIVRIKFHPLNGAGGDGENISYKARTMLRRYLCEVRDNYIAKGMFMFTSLLRGSQ